VEQKEKSSPFNGMVFGSHITFSDKNSQASGHATLSTYNIRLGNAITDSGYYNF